MPQAELTIRNLTRYQMRVRDQNDRDISVIDAGAVWQHQQELDQTCQWQCVLTQSDGTAYVRGCVSFGAMAGVYIDRGWQAPNDQSIKVTADVDGTRYVQMTNGGRDVVAWNAFKQGGVIDVSWITV